jgi:alanyl-tRNA synthetase
MTDRSLQFKIVVPIPPERIMPGYELFKLKDTYGFPLMMSLNMVMDKKMFIEWQSYYDESMKAGHNPESVLQGMRNACIDSGYNFPDYIQPTFSEFVEQIV